MVRVSLWIAVVASSVLGACTDDAASVSTGAPGPGTGATSSTGGMENSGGEGAMTAATGGSDSGIGGSGGTVVAAGGSVVGAGGIPPTLCGDGVRNGFEQCDGADLGGATCTSALGSPATGTPTCGADCSIVTTGCGVCGDGVRNGTESCDGNDAGTNTCASVLGRSARGVVRCTATCEPDPSDCTYCGDGVRKAGEACEGSDLGGASCASVVGPGAKGTLGCSPLCMFDTFGCDPQLPCGDIRGLDATSPWPMARRCPTQIGRTVFDGPHQPLREIYTFQLGPDPASSRPCGGPPDIVVDSSGVVYAAGCDGLHAVLPDGTEKWSYVTPGYASAPVLSDTIVYVLTGTSIHSVDRTTGTLVGKISVGISANLAYGTAMSGGVLRVAGEGLGAFQTTGTKLWGVTGTRISQPAVDTAGVTYVSSAAGLQAFDITGATLWTVATTEALLAPPVVARDGTIYAEVSGDSLSAIASSGAVRWSVPLLYNPSAAALASDGTIYTVTTNQGVVAIEPGGTMSWSSPGLATNSVARASRGPTVGRDGTIYVIVNSGPGRVVALDPTGAEIWSYGLTDAAYGTPVIGSDSTLYAVDNNHEVIALANQ